jgi:hypothetical protein
MSIPSKQNPDVPDYLKDLRNIVLRESHSDPNNIRPDTGYEDWRGKLYPLLAPSLQHLQGCGGFGSVGFKGFLETVNRSDRVIVLDEQTTEDAFVYGPEADTQSEMPQTSQPAQKRLDVMNNFQRSIHRSPQFRSRWPHLRSCMDEICVVDTEGLSDTELNRLRFPQQIDCNALFPEVKSEGAKLAASFAAFHECETVVGTLRNKIPSMVHKQGAKTGHTTGIVVGLEEYEENYGQQSRIGPETDDVYAFRLVVEWLSYDELFTDSGDSGSLVYAEQEGKIVPLGIHVGSSEGRSYAWLLWSWCDELYTWLNAYLIFDLCVSQDVS